MVGYAFSLAGWPPPNFLPNRETRNLTLHKPPQFRPGELRKRTGTYSRGRNLSSVPRTSVHFSNEEICNYWVVVAWGFGENDNEVFSDDQNRRRLWLNVRNDYHTWRSSFVVWYESNPIKGQRWMERGLDRASRCWYATFICMGHSLVVTSNLFRGVSKTFHGMDEPSGPLKRVGEKSTVNTSIGVELSSKTATSRPKCPSPALRYAP